MQILILSQKLFEEQRIAIEEKDRLINAYLNKILKLGHSFISFTLEHRPSAHRSPVKSNSQKHINDGIYQAEGSAWRNY